MVSPIKLHAIMLITLWCSLPATNCLAMDTPYVALPNEAAAAHQRRVTSRASAATGQRGVVVYAAPTTNPCDVFVDTTHTPITKDEQSVLDALRAGGMKAACKQLHSIIDCQKHYLTPDPSFSPDDFYGPPHDEQFTFLLGLTPLMLAAHTGFAQCLQEMLTEHQPLNSLEALWPSLREYVPCNHNHPCFSPSLKTNAARYKHATPLFFAAGSPNPQCLQIILSHASRTKSPGELKHHLNLPIKHCGTTPLMHTVSYNRPTCVRTLIEAGAELNKQNKEGETALSLAAKHNHPECAQILIEAGADLNLQNKARETALSLAAKYNHLDCLQMLLDAGAQLNPKGAVSPFKEAKQHANNECLQILNAARAHDKAQKNGALSNPGSKSCSVS